MTKAARTKAALLEAAEQAARARGHDGFSYADLSARVGIQKASIHYHFKSKDMLLTALMRSYRERIEAEYKRFDAAPTGGARLSQFLDMHRDALNGAETVCLCVSLAMGRDGLAKETRREIQIFRDLTLSWLRGVFELGARDGTIGGITDLGVEGPAALAIAEGAQVSARAEGDMARFEAATASLRKRIKPL